MTYSIVAVDEETRDLGVAVQSKSLASGAVVPYVRAGVGAVATQAWSNPGLGPAGLRALERGLAPEVALETILAEDPGREDRQVGLLAASGAAAAYTGGNCPEWAGHVVGEGYAVQGNHLVSELTLRGMVEGFLGSEGAFAHHLIRALEGGQAQGGDRRGMQSAAVLVARKGGGPRGLSDILVDLRVDDHPSPIEELARLLMLSEARPWASSARRRQGTSKHL